LAISSAGSSRKEMHALQPTAFHRDHQLFAGRQTQGGGIVLEIEWRAFVLLRRPGGANSFAIRREYSPNKRAAAQNWSSSFGRGFPRIRAARFLWGQTIQARAFTKPGFLSPSKEIPRQLRHIRRSPLWPAHRGAPPAHRSPARNSARRIEVDSGRGVQPDASEAARSSGRSRLDASTRHARRSEKNASSWNRTSRNRGHVPKRCSMNSSDPHLQAHWPVIFQLVVAPEGAHSREALRSS